MVWTRHEIRFLPAAELVLGYPVRAPKVAANCLEFRPVSLPVEHVHDIAFPRSALRRFRHFFCRNAGCNFDFEASARMVRHQPTDHVAGFANHPTRSQRHHPPGLRAAYLQAIEIGFSAVSFAIVLDAELCYFAVHGSGHSRLRALYLPPCFWWGPD